MPPLFTRSTLFTVVRWVGLTGSVFVTIAGLVALGAALVVGIRLIVRASRIDNVQHFNVHHFGRERDR